MPSPEPIIRIIRPQLTPEERERRMKILNERIVDFWHAVERKEKQGGKTNVGNDHRDIGSNCSTDRNGTSSGMLD